VLGGRRVRRHGSYVFSPPVTDVHDVPAEAARGRDGRLYHSTAQGVTSANPRTCATRLVLPSVHWSTPTVSPDGGFIAFVTVAGEVPRLQLLDTRSGGVVAGFERQMAMNPQYVTATSLWLNEAEALSQSMTPYQATDRVVSYDQARGVETRMGFTGSAIALALVATGIMRAGARSFSAMSAWR